MDLAIPMRAVMVDGCAARGVGQAVNPFLETPHA
jgi:hypothetical protein